jgi:NitT/TauT family transport system permease protein
VLSTLPRRIGAVDLLVLGGLAGLVFGVMRVAHEWSAPLERTVTIDLSLWALPRYAFFSLSRGLAAYVLSLIFTLFYGYWSAKDRRAERVLVPLLDILQSIPVLGFMPGLVLALIRVFPDSNAGLELAAVIMIFTGQAWNMTFSFHHSLRSVPAAQQEVATLYRFTWWQRLKWVELPFSTTGLVWNSMMSMAGGWFFLMINEAFVLGGKDFRLPGLGSYMSVATARGDVWAMAWAMVAMILMIVVLDQVLWRPLVVWAQKFRVEEGAKNEKVSSWVLDLFRRSRVLSRTGAGLRSIRFAFGDAARSAKQKAPKIKAPGALTGGLSVAVFVALLGVLGLGLYRLVHILIGVPLGDWGESLGLVGLTLARALGATAIGTLWALPAGLAIGLSPRLSRVLQPVVQVAASFPAPMLFPAAVAAFRLLGVSIGWGSVVLMLLGTQWYILFNVIAGASSIPGDMREVAVSYRLGRWARFRSVYFPAVFPFLVTGWVTAAGGAWNASIVAEYVTFRGEVLVARGIGSQISRAAESGNLPLLAASVSLMSLVVVLFNRTVWRACYRLAERKYSIEK